MSEELIQCPYDKSCKCRMDEPCLGCESFNPDKSDTLKIDKAVAEIESNIADLTEFVTDYNQMINGYTAIATLNKIKTILKGG